MTEWIPIALIVVWLAACGWIIQDATVYFPRSVQTWWALLGLLLGPIAVPFYLSERMRQRAEANKFGHGKEAFPMPGQRRAFRGAGLRRYTDLPRGGSGIVVVVAEGQDANLQAEIPATGELIIRRGTPYERSHPGVLILHDEAVSRQEHCRISLRDGQIVLEDSSRWGTTIDGERVRGEAVFIALDHEIKVGKTILRFRAQ